MKTIFKVGDKAYHWKYGWGKLTETNTKVSDDFPIEVKFNLSSKYFTIDGRLWLGEPPTLSFTEYDFVNGGFSQERPKPKLPEIMTVVYIGFLSENKEFIEWSTGFYYAIYEGVFTAYKYVCNYDFLTSGQYLALENPLLNTNTPVYKAEDYI